MRENFTKTSIPLDLYLKTTPFPSKIYDKSLTRLFDYSTGVLKTVFDFNPNIKFYVNIYERKKIFWLDEEYKDRNQCDFYVFKP